MEFQFVNSTPEDPAVPQDKAVRVLIRKQAMKNASAARKRDGNYGKHNLRQLPLFIPPKSPALRAYVQLRSPGSSPNSASSDGTTASSKGPQTARQVPLDTPAAIATVTPAPPAKRPALSIATATASARNRNKQLQRLERQTPLDVQTQAWLHNYFLAQGLASPVSPTDFEAMSIAHGFNLLELSTLAT